MPARQPAAPTVELAGAVWMTVAGRSLGGNDRIDLLRAIEATGSISQAAKAIGMSYKGAWDAVDTMNNLAGMPLVERNVGGRGGGGTRLTERGEQLVRRYAEVDAIHRRFVELLSASGTDLTRDLDLLRTFNMKTSARNQFAGTVSKLTLGAVNDEVELTLAGGHRLVAVVTHESVESLGLAAGSSAFALIKASSIIVATDVGPGRLSARNQLAGTVSRVQAGAVNSEVVIDLSGGGTIAAIVTQESAASLGLVPGAAATAIFKASSVILGVPA